MDTGRNELRIHREKSGKKKEMRKAENKEGRMYRERTYRSKRRQELKKGRKEGGEAKKGSVRAVHGNVARYWKMITKQASIIQQGNQGGHALLIYARAVNQICRF